MRIIEQSATILDWSRLDLCERVETAARVCRRSESKGDAAGFVRSLIKRGHYPPLEFARIVVGLADTENVRRIREQAAEGVTIARVWLNRIAARWPALVEGCGCVPDAGGVTVANDWVPVLFTTSRTISHQLVRYRNDICFMQESQRHVRYDRDIADEGDKRFGIEVIEPPGLNEYAREHWEVSMWEAAFRYREMMRWGATAEQARAVLPGCVATRILAYASPAQWRHIFGQRCDSNADPQMAALMIPLREEMRARGLI